MGINYKANNPSPHLVTSESQNCWNIQCLWESRFRQD